MMAGAAPMLGTPHSTDHDIPALRLRDVSFRQKGPAIIVTVFERCSICEVILTDDVHDGWPQPPKSARDWRDLIGFVFGEHWVAAFGEALSAYSADANNHLVHFVPRIDGNPRLESACGRYRILNRAYVVPLVTCLHCLRTHEYREAEARYLETKAAVAAMEDEDD